MKTLLTSLLTLLLSSASIVAFAADYYKGIFTFKLGVDDFGGSYIPVCYEYGYPESPTPGDVDVPLAKNEVIRAFIVRDKRIVTPTTTPSIVVDAAGQLVKVKDENGEENAIDAKWLQVRYKSVNDAEYTYADYITVGDTLGVPNNPKVVAENWTSYDFEVYTNTDLSGDSNYKVYLYLVALDTRTGMGECEGSATHVRAYAMSLCAGRIDTNYAPERYPVVATSDTPREWSVGTYDAIPVYWPGDELAWQPCAEIKSLAVDGEILTGDDLTDYLTPEVASMTISAEALTLTATAPDVQYYTLYTTDNLTNGSWKKFEDFVNNDENFVDKTIGKRYTRFCIDGKGLSIPVIFGETSRFYQLRGE